MWRNSEIKKGSKLIIRPGQDAIFLYNGKIEGIFKDEGNYEVETQIIPFLSTLKGFKFGFKTDLRAEVLFVNTKQFVIKWGTKAAINIPTPNMPGGLPIRCFGTYTVSVHDYVTLIDKIAGIKQEFTIDDIKLRTQTILDQLIMRSIVKEGKDMFNLQVNSYEIARGIKMDLDMELLKIGLTVDEVNVASFNYPDDIQKMIEKNASYGMVGDMDKYTKINMVDSMKENPGGSFGNMAQTGAGLAMGIEMAKAMSGMFSKEDKDSNSANNGNLKKCPNCGVNVDEKAKFCSNCGNKIEASNETKKFCPECGAKLEIGAKFCNECGNKI
jgi:membrane protease subunit (stomatin/prohibitin family)